MLKKSLILGTLLLGMSASAVAWSPWNGLADAWRHGLGLSGWLGNHTNDHVFHPCDYYHPHHHARIGCHVVGHHGRGGYSDNIGSAYIPGNNPYSSYECHRAEEIAVRDAFRKCYRYDGADICRITECFVY